VSKLIMGGDALREAIETRRHGVSDRRRAGRV